VFKGAPIILIGGRADRGEQYRSPGSVYARGTNGDPTMWGLFHFVGTTNNVLVLGSTRDRAPLQYPP